MTLYWYGFTFRMDTPSEVRELPNRRLLLFLSGYALANARDIFSQVTVF
ncbi:hypothetical protein ACFLSF_03595 [Candidatus Bipolaricaulota bacterium]